MFLNETKGKNILTQTYSTITKANKINFSYLNVIYINFLPYSNKTDVNYTMNFFRLYLTLYSNESRKRHLSVSQHQKETTSLQRQYTI
jgi:hypothetical protein